MTEAQTLAEKVHEANIDVHRMEASYYELLHPEIYGKHEQKRLTSTLLKVDKLIKENHKLALDFGAGTGNLTGKLLCLGYRVTAVDISPEMCKILRKKFQHQIEKKRLTVINSTIEDEKFVESNFDLIAGYSVLHHLPDFEETLTKLSRFLKRGGIMFLDHEASPFYWKPEPTSLAQLVKGVYFHSNPILNTWFFRIIGLKMQPIEYDVSDYWHKKGHAIDHFRIQQVFKKEKFETATRVDYHLKGSWIINPIYLIFNLICRPEMSYWIARK